MPEAVILSAARTPIGRFQGGLASKPAPQLGAVAVRAAVSRAGVEPALVELCIMGNVLPAGLGQNPARQAGMGAGLPATTGGLTVNKVCGSGLQAVMLAAQAIRCGDAGLMAAGGMESMTNAPYLLPDARAGSRLGHSRMLDSLVHDGLWCPFCDWHMGMAAEHIAKAHGVTRAQMDAYAAESHRRAAAADFSREIVPVEVPGEKRGEKALFSKDEGIRADSTAEKLAKLKPAFDQSGAVTAGNASTINDGAAAVVVASAEKAKALGKKPLARIIAYGSAGVEPKEIFYAPVHATQVVLKKAGLQLSDIDLFEYNEAFAAQVLADGKGLGLDMAKVNVRGGAIALGHPLGASGARVLVTLLHAMEDLGKRRGLAGLCLGGGEAVAMVVERA